MKAYPIDIDGNRIGNDVEFPDEQWAKMQRIKNLRWVEVVEETPPIERVEMTREEILSSLTKAELIERYGGDMSMTKKELITKIIEDESRETGDSVEHNA